jgi:hypothetical protein
MRAEEMLAVALSSLYRRANRLTAADLQQIRMQNPILTISG